MHSSRTEHLRSTEISEHTSNVILIMKKNMYVTIVYGICLIMLAMMMMMMLIMMMMITLKLIIIIIIIMWFTSCLLEPMNHHLDRYKLMEIEQRGAKVGCSGIMNNLLIDRMVT